ncbi:cytochrome P450 family protein [Penicillium angulare]|uniref:cytochrome P450 family protein n=1 Tax=Penicillium angulare TaxID=116970 RepID=UPI0025423A39|nr:cytochrome P450 family protein [Penicillium angulare]KAJ5280497.1 cytochrome P450 family protein [Penicillium angulare]
MLKGLPLGYLNQLEQRLAETEAAFYGALVTLRNLRNVPIVQPATKADEQRPKSTRMEEWSKLPLRNWPDMEHWMNQTSDQFTLNNISSAYPVGAPRRGDENPIGQHDNRTRSSVDGEIEEIPTPYTWQSQNEVSMRSPYENHSYPQAIGSSPGYVHDAVGSGTAGVAPSLSGDPDDSLVMGATGSEPARVKAAELSRNKSSIYF